MADLRINCYVHYGRRVLLARMSTKKSIQLIESMRTDLNSLSPFQNLKYLLRGAAASEPLLLYKYLCQNGLAGGPHGVLIECLKRPFVTNYRVAHTAGNVINLQNSFIKHQPHSCCGLLL